MVERPGCEPWWSTWKEGWRRWACRLSCWVYETMPSNTLLFSPSLFLCIVLFLWGVLWWLDGTLRNAISVSSRVFWLPDSLRQLQGYLSLLHGADMDLVDMDQLRLMFVNFWLKWASLWIPDDFIQWYDFINQLHRNFSYISIWTDFLARVEWLFHPFWYFWCDFGHCSLEQQLNN